MSFILLPVFLYLTAYGFRKKREYVLAAVLVGQPLLKLMIQPFNGQQIFLALYCMFGFLVYEYYVTKFKVSITSHKTLITVITLFLCGGVFFISSVFSPAKEYGLSKTMTFFISTVVIVIIMLIAIKEQADLLKFYSALANLSLLMAIITEIALFSMTGSFVARLGTSVAKELDFMGVNLAVSIWFGRRTGLGFIASLFAIKEKRTLCGMLRTILLFVFTLLSLSRGPIIMVFICLAIYLVHRGKDAKSIFSSGVLTIVIGVLVGAVITYIGINSVLLSRFFSPDENYTARTYLYKLAWELFKANPFGVGFGAFALYGGINEYPHNLFLEILCELGVFGALCFVWFVIQSLITYFKNKKSAINTTSDSANLFGLMVLVFAVGNSMLSGNVGSNEYVGFSFALMNIISVLLVKKSPQKQPDYIETPTKPR